MKNKTNNFATKHRLVIVLSVVALIFGSYLGWQNARPQHENHRSHGATKTTATLAQINLPDIDKNLRGGEQWLGKVVVVNHWATWCPPCLEEIPLLIEYQRRLGTQSIQIIGIAHDMLDTARAYGDSVGINYPSLIAITGGGELMQQQGNPIGGLPFTAFFDRQGNLANTHIGILSEEDLNKAIEPLL